MMKSLALASCVQARLCKLKRFPSQQKMQLLHQRCYHYWIPLLDEGQSLASERYKKGNRLLPNILWVGTWGAAIWPTRGQGQLVEVKSPKYMVTRVHRRGYMVVCVRFQRGVLARPMWSLKALAWVSFLFCPCHFGKKFPKAAPLFLGMLTLPGISAVLPTLNFFSQPTNSRLAFTNQSKGKKHAALLSDGSNS